jgi:hypothetical protein
MIFGNLILTSTFIARHEIFNSIGGFDTKYETLEDYDLFLKITKEYPVAFIDTPLVLYTYSQNQLSGDTFYAKLCVNLMKIFEKNIHEIKDKNFLKRHERRIKKHRGLIHARLGYYYFSHEKMKLSAKHYWQSIINNPAMSKAYVYLLFSILPKTAARLIRKCKSFT